MLHRFRSISPDWNDQVLRSVFAKTLLIRLNVVCTTHERIVDDPLICDKHLARHHTTLMHVPLVIVMICSIEQAEKRLKHFKLGVIPIYFVISTNHILTIQCQSRSTREILAHDILPCFRSWKTLQ